ncbi:MAG: hypothetical protein HY347_12590 [candidate division NC10 bacterium]|nr:hypothetical protein [candidate division NC10 bacterium]
MSLLDRLQTLCAEFPVPYEMLVMDHPALPTVTFLFRPIPGHDLVPVTSDS